MTRTLTLLTTVLAILLFPAIVFAISSASSSGTLSVDWDQDEGVFIWSTNGGDSPIYGMNGADAIWGTENFTLVDNNRVYDRHESDYDSPGWVNNIEDVADTSSVGYGSAVEGTAATTTTSVYSSGAVSNSGAGLTLNASGTSHLVRDFTISATGEFRFDVTYEFADSAALEDPTTESADWFHHVNLILGYHTGTEWKNLDEVIVAYGISDSGISSGMLSVIDPDGWSEDREYSIELHTYNSASAYSSANGAAPVPEPSTILLLGGGLLGLGWYGRKRKKV